MFRSIAMATLLLASSASAHNYGNYTANPYAPNRVNPYQSGGNLYTNDGQFRGTANNNQYDPNSTSNPYGRYGSQYSQDSVNNPYGAGSQYNTNSPNNPYGQGLRVCGPNGCN